MRAASGAFLEGDYEAAISLSEEGVDAGHVKAVVLAADAHYALQTALHREKALQLYLRSIYDLQENPYPDHCYFRIASIYYEQDKLEDAALYDEQLIKRFPGSVFLAESLLRRFEMAVKEDRFDDAMTRAKQLFDATQDENLRERVRGVAYVQTTPPPTDPDEIWSMLQKHMREIIVIPPALLAYGDRLARSGDVPRAFSVYMDLANLYPNKPIHATALLHAADLQRQQGAYQAARLLLENAVQGHPDSDAAQSCLQRALSMLESGQIHAFHLRSQALTYPELLALVSKQATQASVKAATQFKISMIQACFGDPRIALQDLRDIQEAYARGPYSGLFRDGYRRLLYAALTHRFDKHRFIEVHDLYQDHMPFLDTTVQTEYPARVVASYLAMGWPETASDLYERLWQHKLRIEGFELAYESLFIDYLELLHGLRKDTLLQARLEGYASMYGPRSRYWDRFMWIETSFMARHQDPEAFLQYARDLPVQVNTPYDADRLRLMALMAREQQDHNWAHELYRQLESWPDLHTLRPALARTIALYEPDQQMRLGNINRAMELYLSQWQDENMPLQDRTWAFLQMARVWESRGHDARALRMYGQLAQMTEAATETWTRVAQRRLSAMANQRAMAELETNLDFIRSRASQ